MTKLAIYLDPMTIFNILRAFRSKGKIKTSLTWKKFLKMQISSIYAMDFFTVDSLLNMRYYVYFIIKHKTREIIQFAITENPVREFVRQQIIEFENTVKSKVYMIRDNAREFNLNYIDYRIAAVRTSVKAPNMNSIAERFVGSVRREALNYFLIFNSSQLKKIITDYVQYYNTLRPHQGIEQNIPKGYSSNDKGEIFKIPILSGLHHHYYRSTA